MNILQSSKEQAASSRTSLKNVINNISQEITVTKDTQTTVAGNTDAPRVRRQSKRRDASNGSSADKQRGRSRYKMNSNSVIQNMNFK